LGVDGALRRDGHQLRKQTAQKRRSGVLKSYLATHRAEERVAKCTTAEPQPRDTYWPVRGKLRSKEENKRDVEMETSSRLRKLHNNLEKEIKKRELGLPIGRKRTRSCRSREEQHKQ